MTMSLSLLVWVCAIVTNDVCAKTPKIRGLWKGVGLRIDLADEVPPQDLLWGGMICRQRLKNAMIYDYFVFTQ